MVNRTGNFVQDRVPTAGGYPSLPLSVAAVYRQRGDAVVGDGGLLRRERSEVPPRSRYEFEQRAHEDAVDLLGRLGIDADGDERFYRIDEEDTYFVEFGQSVNVPSGHVGVVRPRETFRRAGALMETSFVAPDQGTVEAHVFVEDAFLLFAEGATVAELVVVETTG